MLLRLCLGITLLYFGATGLSFKPAEPIAFVQNLIATAGGIFLLAGLWTPPIGALIALDQLWFTLLPQRDTWMHIFLAMLAASVAMLGPGAWSIDARLFGRKRFDIGPVAPNHPTKG